MGHLTLVLGGIKTGKTRFAQEKAEEYDKRGEPVIYLATAQAFDDEMKDRISRHQADRPDHWITIEEPLDVARAVQENTGENGIILLDCLTLWMTNTMAADIPSDEGTDALPNRDRVWERITREMDNLCSAVHKMNRDLIIISNQVENGLVSEYAFARMYQDMAGMTHQYLAKRAESVYTMIAGIPLCLKNIKNQEKK